MMTLDFWILFTKVVGVGIQLLGGIFALIALYKLIKTEKYEYDDYSKKMKLFLLGGLLFLYGAVIQVGTLLLNIIASYGRLAVMEKMLNLK